MDRREFLQAMGITSAGAILAPSALADGTGKKKPNLLIIHGDEFNFRYIGCYGDKIIQTPHIDAIAENGTRCDNFYANHPVCTPSRGSMMTGRYPQCNGAIANDHPLKEDEITFAEQIRKAGYKTGYSGKWHLDGHAKPGWAPKRQFGWEDNRFMVNRGHWKELIDTPSGPAVGQKNGKNSYGAIGNKETFTTDWLADKTVDFIKANKANPFCYMVSIPDPHGPNTVRAPYNQMLKGKTLPKPLICDENPEDRPAWARSRGFHGPENRFGYYGMIKCIDDNVGKIVKALKDEGIYENTIIVFCADHGDLMGEHGLNNKGVPYEASAKVPFIIQGPGGIPKGKVNDNVISMVDFGPTMMGLLGIDKSGREQGYDASKVLTGKKSKWDDIAFLCNHGGKGGGWLGAATKEYKLVYDVVGEPWLFDLKKDPEERKNFFSKPAYKSIVKEMTEKLLVYGQRCDDTLLNEVEIKKGMDAAIAGETEKYAGKKATLVPKAKKAKGGKKRKKKGAK